MFVQKEVERILRHAESMDSEYELFGASKHRYKLNPPVDKAFVREVEEAYHFRLPEDYVQFITEVGDGGAGPDYGISPFQNFLEKGTSPGAEKFREAYRCSLAEALKLRPMEPDEIEEYAFAKEAYRKNPERYFANTKQIEDDTLCDTDGYYVLGTHGCQWDFGLVTAGERYGQVFDTDNEGGFCFMADSFQQFYQNWLDYISDEGEVLKELEMWRRVRNRK